MDQLEIPTNKSPTNFEANCQGGRLDSFAKYSKLVEKSVKIFNNSHISIKGVYN